MSLAAVPPRLLTCLAFLALLSGCAVGPRYRRPEVPAPPAFKEAAGWKAAAPGDPATGANWWLAFGDADLNALEGQVAAANPTLQEAAANYEAARQIARAELATLFPSVSVDAGVQRAKARQGAASATSSASASGAPLVSVPNGGAVNTYSATGSASWSPDLFGRIRNQTAGDIASAQASAAELANARLSLQSQLAVDYLQLRILDARRRLLEGSVESYRRTLQIAKNKYSAGVAARNDVITAQTQLDSTRAQAIDARIQRAQHEHAIAVLIGKAPADFTLAERDQPGPAVPEVPAVIPSQLLERRPDIAAAERSAASANARIGVAFAAYFPSISLSADGGFQGSPLSRLFTVPFRFWTLGASAGETLFDFGARRALLKEAEAGYDAQAAAYRQAVLTAFQQVEDNLSTLRLLAEEAAVQDNAVNEAAQASRIAENEYRAGTVDYTTVIQALQTELQNRETALTILQNRLTAAVDLIEATGGGWAASDLPTRWQVIKR